jgi:Viral BACON domain
LPQILSIASTDPNTNTSFNATATTSKGGAWLTVSPSGTECCTTPESVTVTVNATTLTAGIYTGQITFTKFLSDAQAITVPVTLTISSTSTPFFDSVPGQMSFTLPPGQTSVPAQTLQIRNAGSGTLTWTASTSTSDGGNWLRASPRNGTAPTTVTISVTPSALPGGGALAGTFVGQVSFAAASGTVTVPVAVYVGDAVFWQVNPINFTMPVGGANPLPQILSIASADPNTNTSFNATATTSKGGAWLTVSPSGTECCTTPESVTVTVNAITLTAGIYTGQITFTKFLSNAQAITVPVILTITSGGAYFDNIPGQATFSFVPSSHNPPAQSVQLLNAGGGALSWTAATSASDGGNWLSVSPRSGTAPSTLSISVRASSLPGGGLLKGSYVGQVALTTNNGNDTVPVVVNVGDPVFVQLPQVSFSTVVGIDPTPQMITVASTSSAIPFDAVAVSAKGGSWLSISPSGNECCSTPEVITVSVNVSGLSPGTYIGQLTFTRFLSNAMDSMVPVILTIN